MLAAAAHGFTQETLGAPIIIADGLRDNDGVEVEVDGELLSKVKIASAAVHADALLVASHMTGHELTAWVRHQNVGMGAGSGAANSRCIRQAKCQRREVHRLAECLRWCPAGAISLEGKGKERKAVIDQDKCIGCGECTVS